MADSISVQSFMELNKEKLRTKVRSRQAAARGPATRSLRHASARDGAVVAAAMARVDAIAHADDDNDDDIDQDVLVAAAEDAEERALAAVAAADEDVDGDG